MKHKGSTFEYKEYRDQCLLNAYREQIRCCETINLTEVFEKVVLMPSPRFWVSEERAAIVIARMLKGDKLESMKHNSREMYEEILRRVKIMIAENPESNLSSIVFQVVNQPAPKFYLTPATASILIPRIRKEEFQKTQKRLRHMFNMG